MLFWVWVGACVPFTWVMVVGEGCSGWCCFQYCVAVVSASRRVPGVGVGVCVLVCSGVGWLVPGVSGVGVAGLVCVVWFRMLMRVAPLSVFFVLLSWFCLFVWLITLPGRVACSRLVVFGLWVCCSGVFCAFVVGWCCCFWWCVSCVGRLGFVWLLGCCPCCW